MKRFASRRQTGKWLAGTKNDSNLSRMDTSYHDDSSDSGIDATELQQPVCQNALLIDQSDRSSSEELELDRDSGNDDSTDSGIFDFSGSDDVLPPYRTVPRVDVSGTLFEESGLASLLCQTVNLSDDSTVAEESRSSSKEVSVEPPTKRIRLELDDATQATDLVESSLSAETTEQMNSTAAHISLLGIVPNDESPALPCGKAASSNSAPSTNSHSHSSRRKLSRKCPSLNVTSSNRTKDGAVELRILAQPEEQHRARYMTEGSRGAIKDKRGTGFPTVKLVGYDRPATLQVFIGTDQGKIQPHLFYQACKVSGKNCTPCSETVIEGTAVIEISMLPEKDMTVSCDCIGILKERNVDVEQRLPYFSMTKAKKKNTRCRMIFRVNLLHNETSVETLQAASSPILCTQPPGVPEISKKSLKESSVLGGTELFVIGKNFLKDTKILLQPVIAEDQENDAGPVWQEVITPDKEFLHQTHLVCRIPPYMDQNVKEPVRVHLLIQSGGKTSEPHTFTYLPAQPGIATHNLGNYQSISQREQGCQEGGTSFGHSQLLPTIIQVPEGSSPNGMQPIIVSNGTMELITVAPQSMPHLGSVSQSTSRHPVMIRPSHKMPKIASKVYSHVSHNRNDPNNPVQLVVVHQGGKAVKKAISPLWTLNNRQRALAVAGKRLATRFGYSRGKHYSLPRQNDLRPRLNLSRQVLHPAAEEEQQMAAANVTMAFKQEMPTEFVPSDLFSVLPVSQHATLAENGNSSSFASEAVQLHVTAAGNVDQQPIFANANSGQPVTDMLNVEQSQSQMVSNMSLAPQCVQVSTPLELNSSPHGALLGPQSLGSLSELVQHQQAEMQQMKQDLLLCQMSRSSMRESATTTLSSNMISSTQLQQSMISDANKLCQAMLASELVNSSQCLVREQYMNDGMAFQSAEATSGNVFSQPSTSLPQLQETILLPTRDQQVQQLPENCQLLQPQNSSPTMLTVEVKPELTPSPTTPGELCSPPTRLRSPLDMHPLEANVIRNSLPLPESMKNQHAVTMPTARIQQGESIAPTTLKAESHMVAVPTQSQIAIGIQVVKAPTSTITSLPPRTTPSAPSSDMGFQNCMSTLSQLSEADLLSFINPSTFDNM